MQVAHKKAFAYFWQGETLLSPNWMFSRWLLLRGKPNNTVTDRDWPEISRPNN